MDYYSKNVKEYIKSTFDSDVSSLYDDFLKDIKPGSKILDVGFGSGRDSLYFQNKGFDVYSLDTCKEFCEHATSIGLKNVLNVSIEDIGDIDKYDGIWACASLLHVKKEKLVTVFNKCYLSLRIGGIMYASFKYGDFSGVRDSRYYVDLNEKSLVDIISKTNFKIIKIVITNDSLSRDNKWINIYLNK